MSSNSNSTTDNNNSTTSNSDSGRSSGLGAATYYGAVAVVVLVLVALTIVSRVLYTRKAKRLAQQRSIDGDTRDAEDRVAMQLRGEAPGLPTYRESVLPTSRNPIIESTPLGDPTHPPRSVSTDTLPVASLAVPVIPTSASEPQISPPAYRISPPKYEDAAQDADRTTQTVGQARDADDPAALPEMQQMRPDSVATLVVPSIEISHVEQSVPSCNPTNP